MSVMRPPHYSCRAFQLHLSRLLSPSVAAGRAHASNSSVRQPLTGHWQQGQQQQQQWGGGGGRRRRRGVEAADAYNLDARRLAPYAQRLARHARFGGDPVKAHEVWSAVAFQVQGLAEELSTDEAYKLLRAFGAAGILARHEGAALSLLVALRRNAATLKPRNVLRAWVVLDRADVFVDRASRAFFQEELRRLLPAEPASRSLAPQDGRRGADRMWRRVHALLEARSCTQEEMQPLWRVAEEVMLATGGAVRALEVDGLVSALRAAALAEARAGVAPSEELTQRLMERAMSQARWFDGWAATHVVLAAARLGVSPGRGYDPLRDVLLERCVLAPPSASPAAWPGPTAAADQARSLRQAERVAAALARWDVHDAVVRGRLTAWLLWPLPARRFAPLALNLARAGCGDASDAKVARHVRARSRSAEAVGAVGAERAEALLEAYAQAD
eukprot:NODE_8925_length_1459_cov_7.655405.p1 GENE.NODE_8925_length_1459_cov_7.655405~~NODE_8925_length_1459_cov_7.655405.p1  ORF type:complete len:463 (+),score=152.92 NODE_8925_length_1459_cov_7.655405:55-1389(+)